MPRDDLSIDFVKMPPVESQDAATVLEDFTYTAQNLPAEIQFMQEEIADKDRRIQECLAIITTRDNVIQKWIRQMGSHTPNPREEQMQRVILENYDKVQVLQEEKCLLAQKTQQVVDKHLRQLDRQIKLLQDKGDFPIDPDIPSLLRPQPIDRAHAAIAERHLNGPLTQITNSAAVNAVTRLTNQQAALHRAPAAPAQAQQISNIAASAPATPTAAAMLINRQTRESSAGASSKRQRLNSSAGMPTATSGLARHASTGPGTPKTGTPTIGRAGSAGPRTMTQKVASIKKVAPHKQSAAVRRAGKPGKSGLSRVKRTGNKTSPSSNDSELSDAESGSADDDDEVTTPGGDGSGGGADGDKGDMDGDEDMQDQDDEEGGDDRKYCTCQSVSYGDMVACDNESCPYEWFHWSCVGLKSEPQGIWICPVCTKNSKKG